MSNIDCAGCSYLDILVELREEFPHFKMVWKKDSRFMKALDRILRIVTLGLMPSFMASFVTTIGFTVYVPEMWASMPDFERMIVLRHERVHMRQRRKYGSFLFSVLYLLCPLPIGLAYFRMRFEREAYEETMRAIVQTYGQAGKSRISTEGYAKDVIGYFTGPSYCWMWPFPGSNRRWFERARKAALSIGNVSVRLVKS